MNAFIHSDSEVHHTVSATHPPPIVFRAPCFAFFVWRNAPMRNDKPFLARPPEKVTHLELVLTRPGVWQDGDFDHTVG